MNQDHTDENVGWPSYVDFLCAFAFLLILFIGSLVFQVSGVIEQRNTTRRIQQVSSSLNQAGIANTVLLNKIVIPLEKQVTFAKGSAVLDQPARTHLGLVAHEIAEACSDKQVHCRRVIVEGHADRVPFKDDPFGNWKLSANRAVSVLEFLYNCRVCGYGEELRGRLILSGQGDLDATQSINHGDGNVADRRVDIILDYSKAP